MTVEHMDDERLFAFAATISRQRAEVRREITKRAGHEVKVFIDSPPLDTLSDEHVRVLRQTAEELAADCSALLVQRSSA